MASPSLEDFVRLADCERPRAIPVFREILGDLDTPVSAFLKVGDGDYAFLLESVEGGERWARYSFIGLDPYLVLRAKGRQCELLRDGWVSRREEREDPLTLLADALGDLEPASVPGMPPFAGGAVGWLGYDAVRWWEPGLAPEHPAGAPEAPELCFALPRSLVIFDNLRHRILVAEVVHTTPGADHVVAWRGACQRIDRLIERLRGPLPPMPHAPPVVGPMRSDFPRPAFEAAVERVKEYIRAGDGIQVVLSQRFRFDYEGDPFDLYRALRAVNPSPYMFFLRYPEQLVIGASPEVMVRVQGDEALVAPIAGTRHRGADEAEDRALEAELLADPKERAEHVMLVDLGRNDLGRVAAPGSVAVEDLMHIERYSHVMHIVSTVKARLAEGRSGLDAVRATFPAGTLSGAPKVRAMQIIDELEPTPRGLYGGAVGYVGYNGNLDLCIAIRTATCREGEWCLQVGAGIVADSDPASEYQETLNKAGGVRRALEVAGGGL
ncbi:MAG: anthranilate synthase component I [Alphaproteobacteria bacterium]|nr:anthranilate synthase component I [Alphaproteobacteria bacterium]